MTLRLVSRDYLPTSAAAGGPWRANYLPTLAGQQLNNKSKFHVWPLACGPASDHSLAGMVLLHLRSSQAEFDAYLFATHGIEKKNQFTLNEPHAYSGRGAAGKETTYLPGSPRRAKSRPTYLPTFVLSRCRAT